MIAAGIAFVMKKLPAIPFVLAIAIAALNKTEPNRPLCYLNWLWLLPTGVVGVWAGIFHWVRGPARLRTTSSVGFSQAFRQRVTTSPPIGNVSTRPKPFASAR
jgi:hypothetical protein